ncbi:hypothetical protein [Mycoplasmopsis cynos]|uniref:hypothetical protein n=1 Tax=Mycoplasmopsis cynos TaxID=171284 RepID=UPI002AFEAA4D|nr:hypothetical protein [Mycoplasmopsis cynos]WQQ14988.1 hypothetical protein RRG42_01445 [Mycoplasmopsis cynos]
MYKNNLKLKSILSNNKCNYIKIIQGSTALNYYNLLKRKNNDIDLLVFDKNDIRVSNINSLFFNDIKCNSNIIVENNIGFYTRFIVPEINNINIEVIFVKIINKNWYKKVIKNIYMVQPEYAFLVKIFQLYSLISEKSFLSERLNVKKIFETIDDLKILCKNKLLYNKTKIFIRKNLIDIIINDFMFSYFIKSDLDIGNLFKNKTKILLINKLSMGTYLSFKITQLFNFSKKDTEKINNIIIISKFILKNKKYFFNYNDILKNTISTNELGINFDEFISKIAFINKSKVILTHQASELWKKEIVEINDEFVYKNILKFINLKFLINNKLSKNEIKIFCSESKLFLLNNLYKIILLLVLI